MKTLHRSIEALEKVNEGELESVTDDVILALDDLECAEGHPVELPGHLSFDMARGLHEATESVGLANERIKSFLAFIKTFEEKEFSTIYCEREWRSTSDFSFRLDDIAMIVLPKTGEAQLFKRFIEEVIPAIDLPRSVPVVPWEDLIEH